MDGSNRLVEACGPGLLRNLKEIFFIPEWSEVQLWFQDALGYLGES